MTLQLLSRLLKEVMPVYMATGTAFELFVEVVMPVDLWGSVKEDPFFARSKVVVLGSICFAVSLVACIRVPKTDKRQMTLR